ncbi:MAG: class I SAM-dependent methyltransferase [Clostridiaceae bacterium]|nr:class I SAM-dependent methyltransferase [Clostridiaceae bacterium]
MVEKIEPYKGISAIYDEIRPTYPEKLIQDVISKTNLKLGNELLEIGAGTGKATIQFAEKGFKIHAIELGKDMAEILKDKCANLPKVSLEVVSFEDWNCPHNEKYDMIYSAQAFHWLDINIKYKKCHKLLKDNGYLILFWYNASDFNLPITREIEEKVGDIVKKFASNYSLDKGKPERRAHDGVSKQDERKAEIEASSLFEVVEKIDYTQERRNNSNQYLKVKKSIPEFASILDGLDDRIIEKMDSEIEGVINNYGGYVSTFFKFSLYITKKVIPHDNALKKES